MKCKIWHKLALGLLCAAIGIGIYIAASKVMQSEQQVFQDIYQENRWGGGSGPGSDPQNAKPYLALLQTYLSDDNINTIVDLGCGDWRLMQTLEIAKDKHYKGFDLVQSVIDNNTKNYARDNVKFLVISGIEDFTKEKGDLLIVKDVLQHWPVAQIQFFLKNILPNFKYALITNGYQDEIKTQAHNRNIKHGKFTVLDLEAAPFNSPDLKVLLDYSSHGAIKRVYLYTNPHKLGEHDTAN